MHVACRHRARDHLPGPGNNGLCKATATAACIARGLALQRPAGRLLQPGWEVAQATRGGQDAPTHTSSSVCMRTADAAQSKKNHLHHTAQRLAAGS